MGNEFKWIYVKGVSQDNNNGASKTTPALRLFVNYYSKWWVTQIVVLSCVSEVYLEPSKTSTMELFPKIFNGRKEAAS